ncbi:MAG TPA: histidine kinase N-terminal 7TM domain-containing protein, partial [Coriobacteriia bacterium]
MVLQFSPYSLIYLTGTAVAAVAIVFAWPRRTAPAGRWLLLMLLSGLIWTLADAAEVSSAQLSGHIFWAQVSYLGASPIVVFLLLFAIEYSGRPRVKPTAVVALLLVPALAIVAVATNSLHHQIWTGFSSSPYGHGVIVYHHGFLYWMVAGYAYLIALAATAILVGFAVRNRDVYRYQSIAVVVAALIPWGAELLFDLAPGVAPGLDASVTLSVSAVILTVSMLQFKLLDLAPVARETLIERLEEAVVVLDNERRIVDANPTARRLFGIVDNHWLGSPAEDVLGAWPRVAEKLGRDCEDASDVLVAPDGRHFALSDNAIRDGSGRCNGSIAVLRDITAYVDTQAALEEANARLQERVAEVERLHEELREEAIRDSLTGLYNRRYLTETLAREVGRARREEYPVSLVMLDADNFKRVNDTHGHAIGDHVMRFLGAQLRSQIRPGDIACRYGGDEF